LFARLEAKPAFKPKFKQAREVLKEENDFSASSEAL